MPDPTAIAQSEMHGLIVQALPRSSNMLAVWSGPVAVVDSENPEAPLVYPTGVNAHAKPIGLWHMVWKRNTPWNLTNAHPARIRKPNAELRPTQALARPIRFQFLGNGELLLWVYPLEALAVAANTEHGYNCLKVRPSRSAGIGPLEFEALTLFPSPKVDNSQNPAASVASHWPASAVVLEVCGGKTVNPIVNGGPLLVEYERNDTGMVKLDQYGRPVIAKTGETPKIGPLVLSFQPNYFKAGAGAWTGGASFSGMVYVRGQRIQLPGHGPWVRVNLSDATAVYHTGPPPIPFPPFEVWYEVAQTYGNIVIP